MCEEEFFNFCESFDFSQYPESHKQFLEKQIVVIKRHINDLRNNGDNRSDNDILFEWIKGKNSSLFRKAWVLEYCGGVKVDDDEYNIPEHFYIKKH